MLDLGLKERRVGNKAPYRLQEWIVEVYGSGMLASVTVLHSFIPAQLMAELIAYIRNAYRTLESDPDFAATFTWGGLHAPALKKRDGATPIVNVQRYIEAKFPGARMIDDHCTFRRLRNFGIGRTSWHIDADAAGTAQFDPCFNTWLPLNDVGDELPSLELVENSEPAMRRLPLLEPAAASRTDEWRRDFFADAPVLCPTLTPGDAIIFSHYVLHRTQPVIPPEGSERVGCEFRFTLSN